MSTILKGFSWVFVGTFPTYFALVCAKLSVTSGNWTNVLYERNPLLLFLIMMVTTLIGACAIIGLRAEQCIHPSYLQTQKTADEWNEAQLKAAVKKV